MTTSLDRRRLLDWGDAHCSAEASETSERLYRETISRMQHANLSNTQRAQLQALATAYEPEIRTAERTAALSETQQKACNEAYARVAATGLRGAEARKLLTRATTRTDFQRAAFRRAAQLRRDFDQLAISVLTPSQQAALRGELHRATTQNEFLILQFSPHVEVPQGSCHSPDGAALFVNLPNVQATAARYRLDRCVPAVKPEWLDRLAATHRRATDKEIKLLRSFWQIDVRTLAPEVVAAALNDLNNLPDVEYAYAVRAAEEPEVGSGVAPPHDPYCGYQGYLNPAPLGIDAASAWGLTGGMGTGVGLIDLERDWNIEHEDLAEILNDPIYGDRQPGNHHGTSVLGEIVAQNNGVGMVGIAPGVDYVALTSRYHAVPEMTEPHIANAVLAALLFMDPGDVLLVEHQTDDGYPAEVELLNFAAIRLAVDCGMIVVEPTGNGNHDLDAWAPSGKALLNRGSSQFRDSGAIVVGASDPLNNHNKSGASCYGSRVDCFGWGNHVATTSHSTAADVLDDGGGDDDKSYRLRFNGTSSAAPIIAGAALLIQGLWKQKHDRALDPIEMRTILSEPTTGTPQGSFVPGHIGVMPNLKAIIEAHDLGKSSR